MKRGRIFGCGLTLPGDMALRSVAGVAAAFSAATAVLVVSVFHA
jgi:hypothetical protein